MSVSTDGSGDRSSSTWTSWGAPWVRGVATVVLFLLAIQLLKSSIDTVAPVLRASLPHLITGDISALGASWLAAYLLLNGSVVAALALTLFDAALITTTQLLLMVFGSRLGAAGIVLLVGFADFFTRHTHTIRRASELGIISFLVTHTIGFPALMAGYAWVYGGLPIGRDAAKWSGRAIDVPHVVQRVVGAVIELLGPLLGFLLGVGLLLTSLKLFDSLFRTVDVEALRTRYCRILRSRWLAFFVGFGVTALTTSIAFSLGIVVPMYNRGHVKRDEAIPYILGANIGTLLDTVIISLFITMTGSSGTVLLVVLVTLLATLPALVFFTPYRALIENLLERITASRLAFGAFLLSLALIPALLVGLGFLLRSGGI